MKVNELTNSLGKIKLSQSDETEIWHNISQQTVPNRINSIMFKKKLKLVFSTCLGICVAILIVFGVMSESVRANYVNLSVELYNVLVDSDNYDKQHIGDSGLKEPISMSKQDITVSINQCIASNSEFFIDYSVHAKGASNKFIYSGDSQPEWSIDYEVHYGFMDVSEKLFEKWDGDGSTTNSVCYPEVKEKNDDKVEVIEKMYGNGFLYKDKPIKIIIYIVDRKQNKLIKFPFDFEINSFYPEKVIPVNETITFENGDYVTIKDVTSTFSRTSYTSSAKLTEPFYMSVSGSENSSPFKCYKGSHYFGYTPILRSDKNKRENYTIRIYDKNKKLVKEIPVNFNKETVD